MENPPLAPQGLTMRHPKHGLGTFRPARSPAGQQAPHLLTQRSEVVGVACGEKSALLVVDRRLVVVDVETSIFEVRANALDTSDAGPAREHDLSTRGTTGSADED